MLKVGGLPLAFGRIGSKTALSNLTAPVRGCSLPPRLRPRSFNILTRKNPEASATLHHHLADDIEARQAKLRHMADESKEGPKPTSQ